MKKYEVKLVYRYVDHVVVDAESKDEAIEKAVSESNDAQFDAWVDAEIIDIGEI
jgi:flavin-binding protein dodecin